MVVAVIDAAFDTSHVAFSKTTSVSDTLGVLDSSTLHQLNSYKTSGVSAQNLYLSKKIAYAYDYGEGDLDLYSTLTSHGTHVAGIIAGDSDTIKGVVSNAQLALLKVGDENGTMYNDTIAAALEDCVLLNVDVVNMSLGSTSGFEVEEDDVLYKAIKSLEEQGVSVICAAGNSSTSAEGSQSNTNAPIEDVDNSSVASPACYDTSVSIANAEEIHWALLNGEKIRYQNTYNSITSEYGEFSQDILGSSDSLDIDYVVLRNGSEYSVGQDADYEGIDVSGKIVVVARGEISFTQKIQNATNHGAIGIIFVNNTSTTVTPQVTTDSIPACLVTKEAGETLLNATTKTLSFNKTYVKAVIANSSSKGVTNNLTLGVDVTGYGTSVYSAANDQSYKQMTGTSMAAPNVAGVFAAVRQYVKNNSSIFNATAKADIAKVATKLIMSNTTLLYDLNDVLASPREQGAGLASISDAISANAYIATQSSDYKTKIELGDKLSKNITLTFTIENYNSDTLELDLSLTVLTELIDNGTMSGMDKELTYTINSINSGASTTLVVPANDSLDVAISITLTNEAIEYLNQYPSGIYIEGYIMLDNTNVSLSCPFIGFYGNWDDVNILDVTAYDDEDDVYMRASTSYGIYADSYYLPLGSFVYNISEKYEGDEPKALEEFASLSIFSQSLYALGYIQLGLLRSAEYIEINVIDLITNEVIYQESQDFVTKTIYYPEYDLLYGGDIFTSISPYSLDLYNNGQYEVQVNIYRKYDKDSDNTISDTYTQKFYVDIESPEIDDVEAITRGNKYYAKFTLSDNHYVQALAICTGSGSSASSVTLNVEDIYPVAIEASGVGQTTELTLDVTDAINNASNGYLYFYIVDYAQNANVYYFSIENWEGTSSGFTSKGSSSSTSNSSKPSTESTIAKTFDFTQTEITVAKNKEVNLASNEYLTSYSIDKKYTWSSSDTSIVAISNGKITGLQAGIAVISVVDEDDNEAKIIVKVDATTSYPSATYKSTSIDTYTMKNTVTNDGSAFFGINLNGASITLAPGESFELSFKYSPYNYNYIDSPVSIEITSSDACLTINNDTYTITASSTGTATLSIEANGVEIASYEVEVVSDMYSKDGVLLACFKQDTTITVPVDITAIGTNAFTYANNVTTVILNNVTTIYKNAFKDNTSIQIIDLSNVVSIYANAFDGCTSLAEADLSSATYIGEYAFNQCKNLTTVVFDDTTIDSISISANAFNGCERLENFTQSTPTPNLIVNHELIITLDYTSILEDTTIQTIGCGALANIDAVNLDLSKMTALTRIEAQAFSGNTKLKRIILPSTIEYIGKEAFMDCTSLMSITIKKSTDQELEIEDYAFANTNISTIDLSQIKTTFHDVAFLNCSNLTYANLGTVQEMGKYTFAATTNLMSVVFEEGTKDIGSYTFAPVTISLKTYYHNALKSVAVPDGIEKINEYTFAYCTALSFTNINLNSVKEVGDYAFLNCTSIKEISLPNVEKLGYAAFAQSSIQKINLNNNKTSGDLAIGELAFYQCEYLYTVNLPKNNNVNITIAKGAFYQCTSLVSYSQIATRSRTYPMRTTLTENGINLARVTSIGDYAFTGCEALTNVDLLACKSIGYAAFAKCDKLTAVTMPVIEDIGRIAFYDTAIGNIEIPNTIKNIGQGAFCSLDANISLYDGQDYSNANIKLESGVVYMKLKDGTYMLVYYPESLTNSTYTIMDNTSIIGEYAFLNNSYITTVIMPSSVKYIGNCAFYQCGSLSCVVYEGDKLITLLSQYSSEYETAYATFIEPDDADSINLFFFVANDDVKELYNSNKTWSELFDNILVGDEQCGIIAFLTKYKELEEKTITSSNKSEFEALKAIYDNLSEEEKTAINNDATVKIKYAQMLSEYNSLTSSNIVNNIVESTGLDTWVVVLIIAFGASFLVFLAAGVTYLIVFRHFEVKKVKEASKETVELTDVFGESPHNLQIEEPKEEPKEGNNNDQDSK